MALDNYRHFVKAAEACGITADDDPEALLEALRRKADKVAADREALTETSLPT